MFDFINFDGYVPWWNDKIVFHQYWKESSFLPIIIFPPPRDISDLSPGFFSPVLYFMQVEASGSSYFDLPFWAWHNVLSSSFIFMIECIHCSFLLLPSRPNLQIHLAHSLTGLFPVFSNYKKAARNILGHVFMWLLSFSE